MTIDAGISLDTPSTHQGQGMASSGGNNVASANSALNAANGAVASATNTVSGLTTALNNTSASLMSAQNQVSVVSNTASQTQTTISNMIQSMNTLKESLFAKSNELGFANGFVEGIQAEIEGGTAKLTEATSVYEGALSSYNDSVSAESSAQNALNSAESTLSGCSPTITKTRDIKDEFGNVIGQESYSEDNPRYSELQSEVSRLAGELANKAVARERAELALERAESDVQHWEDFIKDMEERLKEGLENQKRLQEEVEQMQTELSDLQGNVEQEQTTLDQLRQEENILNQNITSLMQEVGQLQEQLTAAQEELRQAEQQRQEAEQALRDAQNQATNTVIPEDIQNEFNPTLAETDDLEEDADEALDDSAAALEQSELIQGQVAMQQIIEAERRVQEYEEQEKLIQAQIDTMNVLIRSQGTLSGDTHGYIYDVDDLDGDGHYETHTPVYEVDQPNLSNELDTSNPDNQFAIRREELMNQIDGTVEDGEFDYTAAIVNEEARFKGTTEEGDINWIEEVNEARALLSEEDAPSTGLNDDEDTSSVSGWFAATQDAIGNMFGFSGTTPTSVDPNAMYGYPFDMGEGYIDEPTVAPLSVDYNAQWTEDYRDEVVSRLVTASEDTDFEELFADIPDDAYQQVIHQITQEQELAILLTEEDDPELIADAISDLEAAGYPPEVIATMVMNPLVDQYEAMVNPMIDQFYETANEDTSRFARGADRVGGWLRQGVNFVANTAGYDDVFENDGSHVNLAIETIQDNITLAETTLLDLQAAAEAGDYEAVLALYHDYSDVYTDVAGNLESTVIDLGGQLVTSRDNGAAVAATIAFPYVVIPAAILTGCSTGPEPAPSTSSVTVPQESRVLPTPMPIIFPPLAQMDSPMAYDTYPFSEIMSLDDEEPGGEAPDTPETIYTVQSGDTLFKIAEANGTTVDAIAAANGISDVNAIDVNQQLVIPTSNASGTANSTALFDVLPEGGNHWAIIQQQAAGGDGVSQDIVRMVNLYSLNLSDSNQTLVFPQATEWTGLDYSALSQNIDNPTVVNNPYLLSSGSVILPDTLFTNIINQGSSTPSGELNPAVFVAAGASSEWETVDMQIVWDNVRFPRPKTVNPSGGVSSPSSGGDPGWGMPDISPGDWERIIEEAKRELEKTTGFNPDDDASTNFWRVIRKALGAAGDRGIGDGGPPDENWRQWECFLDPSKPNCD